MEITALFEVFSGPTAKINKLKKFLTPELMAEKHELILDYIASKSTGSDIDLLQKHVSGEGIMDQDGLDFSYDMIIKKLGLAGIKVQRKPGNDYGWLTFEHLRGTLYEQQVTRKGKKERYYEEVTIWYKKGKYHAMITQFLSQSVPTGMSSSMNIKADTDVELCNAIIAKQKTAPRRAAKVEI